jgi:hypothetical protein
MANLVETHIRQNYVDGDDLDKFLEDTFYGSEYRRQVCSLLASLVRKGSENDVWIYSGIRVMEVLGFGLTENWDRWERPLHEGVWHGFWQRICHVEWLSEGWYICHNKQMQLWHITFATVLSLDTAIITAFYIYSLLRIHHYDLNDLFSYIDEAHFNQNVNARL